MRSDVTATQLLTIAWGLIMIAVGPVIVPTESDYQHFGRCRHLQLREPLDAEFLWLL